MNKPRTFTPAEARQLLLNPHLRGAALKELIWTAAEKVKFGQSLTDLLSNAGHLAVLENTLAGETLALALSTFAQTALEGRALDSQLRLLEMLYPTRQKGKQGNVIFLKF